MHGRPFMMLTALFVSMPASIAWHGMHTGTSTACPTLERTFHHLDLRTFKWQPLFLGQNPLDNAICSNHGYGGLVKRQKKMELGWMTVSDHVH
jgi:hypothetical protein